MKCTRALYQGHHKNRRRRLSRAILGNMCIYTVDEQASPQFPHSCINNEIQIPCANMHITQREKQPKVCVLRGGAATRRLPKSRSNFISLAAMSSSLPQFPAREKETILAFGSGIATSYCRPCILRSSESTESRFVCGGSFANKVFWSQYRFRE